MNGYQSESEDNSPKPQRVCCLIEDKDRCKRLAGNACYSKRIQKTVAQKKLKLAAAESVSCAIVLYIYKIIERNFNRGFNFLGRAYLHL